jgi:aspartyl-tRNA(Asn)/glutamyl-tRNA(Gln) amidotransferase subunit B
MKNNIVVGLEVHVELLSVSKLFSPSPANPNGDANSAINFIDLAYPGTLPSLNKNSLFMALKACKLFECQIAKQLTFDRKNYFYADNSKNYQITQERQPLGKNGLFKFFYQNELIAVPIRQVHLEEDTAKSKHLSDHTLLDFNRSGLALIEIVTEPVFTNTKLIYAFLEALREQLVYSDLSDGKLEDGSIRVDLNISVIDSKTGEQSPKIEVKNLNSFKAVLECIEIEEKRISHLMMRGEDMFEESRRYDETSSSTISMRSREDQMHYRFTHEPNILPIDLYQILCQIEDTEIIQTYKLRKDLKMNPLLTNKNIEVLISNKKMYKLYSDCLYECKNPDLLTNLLLNDVASFESIDFDVLTTDLLLELMSIIQSDMISYNSAVKVLNELKKNESLVLKINELDLLQINDDVYILDLIKELKNERLDLFEEYHEGNERVIKFLMGSLMKKTKGKLNPNKTMEYLLNELKK